MSSWYPNGIQFPSRGRWTILVGSNTQTRHMFKLDMWARHHRGPQVQGHAVRLPQQKTENPKRGSVGPIFLDRVLKGEMWLWWVCPLQKVQKLSPAQRVLQTVYGCRWQHSRIGAEWSAHLQVDALCACVIFVTYLTFHYNPLNSSCSMLYWISYLDGILNMHSRTGQEASPQSL